MRTVLHLAWIAVVAAGPAAAGGEKKLQTLLTEGYELKATVERFVILQQAPAPLVGGAAPAFLCPVDPTSVLRSLREAICEPLLRPEQTQAAAR
jgi:hypothetical protein